VSVKFTHNRCFSFYRAAINGGVRTRRQGPITVVHERRHCGEENTMTASKAYDRTSRLALTDGMHVISRKRLKEAVARHGDLEVPLDAWFRIAKKAGWKSLADVRKTFSSADAVGKWTVFNVKGNRY